MASVWNMFYRMFPRRPHTNDTNVTADSETPIRNPELSADPNKAWSVLSKSIKKKIVQLADPFSPIPEDCVRFVCISDTHAQLERQQCQQIPDGDILLHAGDFTMFGAPEEVLLFNKYLGSLPHRHKVVIAGNHDNTFDLDFISKVRRTWRWSLNEDNYDRPLHESGAESVHDLLTSCIYLEDSMVEIYGIKIYGSPWQPGPGTWGFNCSRGSELLQHWNKIPDDTDVLLTHGPPCGYGDNATEGGILNYFLRLSMENHIGCVDLLNTVQHRVKPRYHVFGHVHEDYGISSDGTTTYINASTCTRHLKPYNPPIVFDFPLPDGHRKTHQEATSDPSEERRWIIETKRKKAPKLSIDK